MKGLSKLKIRTAFGLCFSLFVALPILLIFIVSALFTLRNVRDDSIDSIRLFHSSLAQTIKSEKESVSYRLSHLVYANSGEILTLALGADTDDSDKSYNAIQALNHALDYMLPPISEILSIHFDFNSGRRVEYKTSLYLTLPYEFKEELKADEGNVHVMAFSSSDYPSIYVGTTEGNLIWVSGISPGNMIDRSGEIDSIMLFQISSVYRTLQSYDVAYSLGRNKIGYTAIVSPSGSFLSHSRMKDSDLALYKAGEKRRGYTFISTSLDDGYEIVTMVKNVDLLSNYLYILIFLLIAIFVVLISFIIFLKLLFANVINPVKKVSDGLVAVEKGELSYHIDASGVREVRNTIHAFNAMARKLRALITDYEDKLALQQNRPSRLFTLYVEGKAEKSQLELFERNFLSFPHRLAAIRSKGRLPDSESVRRLLDSFDEFSSSCLVYRSDDNNLLLFYRESEKMNALAFFEKLSSNMSVMFSSEASILISDKIEGAKETATVFEELKQGSALLPLMKIGVLEKLSNVSKMAQRAYEEEGKYIEIANAIISDDIKKITEERNHIINELQFLECEEVKIEVLALLVALANVVTKRGISFDDLAGEKSDSYSLIIKAEDSRSLILYLRNFISSAEEYVHSLLGEEGLSPINKARRYIADNYNSQDISLSSVAEYVSLNERYFSTLFARETGETFISYLTALRMQNAALLLKTHEMRVYEVALMCGYQNPEHFNKAFKKYYGYSPSEYRKMNNSQEK